MASSTPQKLLRAAILIVSDTASKDPSTDKAAPILKEVFETEGAGKWDTATAGSSDSNGIAVKIVPDHKAQIQDAITTWADSQDFYNLIITTGGTGFTPKDNTPEAVSPLLHRHAPGLV